jgi:hypothetical protein
MPKTETLIAVDPGTGYHGWGLFELGVLTSAGVWKQDAWLFRFEFPGVELCVCETQKVHGGTGAKVHDIVTLARCAGEIAGQFRKRHYIWDATPKPIRQQRALDALSTEELIALDRLTASELYHVLDAVAFGLKYLRRI